MQLRWFAKTLQYWQFDQNWMQLHCSLHTEREHKMKLGPQFNTAAAPVNGKPQAVATNEKKNTSKKQIVLGLL